MVAWRDRKVDWRGRTITPRAAASCATPTGSSLPRGMESRPVRRFIARLQTDTMVDTSSDTGCRIIIICNYDQYQAAKDQTGTDAGTVPDTSAIRGRYTGGTREKEGKEGVVAGRAGPPPLLGPFTADVVRLPPHEPDQAVDAWNALAARHSLPKGADRLPAASKRHPVGLGLIADDNPSVMQLEVVPVRWPPGMSNGWLSPIEQLQAL